MGVYYETIPQSLVPWILEQQMLFVGTAPLSGDGHVNISPKSCRSGDGDETKNENENGNGKEVEKKGGGRSFGIIDERTFWYMDLTGSGVETHAHLHEEGNGRICVMFIAFTGPPRILRIWGTGHALENGTPAFTSFVQQNNVPLLPGSRSIILINVHQCASSCGFSVPYYDFKAHRNILNDHFRKKEEKFRAGREEESIDRYWAYKSQASIDGLPGMKRGVEYAKRHGVVPIGKMVGRYAPKGPRNAERVGLVRLVLVLLLGVVIGGVMAVSFVTPEWMQVLQRRRVLLRKRVLLC
ncbi:hypothetical protein EJ02DRAFT_116047 [Clathrospora elynae]|uniref:Uncharacterized protein n=1 Tax=Clathrospora elynae TaxID=706981 RepID=A0A6A5SEC9_9PLEO|nr:hypothetical protein EJ02DRAFT_116047 [Clathrospora elynae]